MGAIALLVLSRRSKSPTNLLLHLFDALVLGIGGADDIVSGEDAGAGAGADARKTPSFLAMFNLFQNIFHFNYNKRVIVVCMH